MTATPLFRPAENTSAFLKMGLLGFQGSGKTKTAGLIAIGLVRYMQKHNIDYAKKPVFFLDTETGSDWLRPDFEKVGIPLYVAKTRAFSDLIRACDEAAENGSFLIVDSISHFWKELCESYARAKKNQLRLSGNYRLQFQDWSYLKGEQGWQQFSDRYVNLPLHMIVCGRAGYEYDYFADDEGKKQLEKTGVKMKAEGEFGFEPSLLVQMELCQKLDGKAVSAVWREAHVLKDRSTLIDGKTFIFGAQHENGANMSVEELTNQTFSAFLPHIRCLNLGGKQLGVDTKRTSEHDISADKKDFSSVQRKICWGEIGDLLTLHCGGQSTADKQRRIQLFQKHFGASATEVEEVMPLIAMRAGFDSLHRDLEGQPSRYAALLAPENTTTELNDSLPDHSAPPAQPSLKDKLIAQLADQQTMNDVMHFMVEVGGMEGLTDAERNEINKAGLTRQTEISKQAGEQNPQPAEEKPPTSPKPPANKGSRGGKDEAKPEMTEAAQAG
ncbi:MAG: AAA family ATPase [Variibacter sp.]